MKTSLATVYLAVSLLAFAIVASALNTGAQQNILQTDNSTLPTAGTSTPAPNPTSTNTTINASAPEPQQETTLQILLIVGAVAAYIAVIAVLIMRKGK